ncbi:hypothetical protein V5049_02560 [Moellerella wisconsensis]|uniref:hypothetical protein n=1 Tax=Moellerella wisconsensis TaxID=158849 RepID=UPI0030761D9A
MKGKLIANNNLLLPLSAGHSAVIIRRLSSNCCHQTIISHETQLGGYFLSATLNAIFPAEPDANYPTSG